MIKSKTIGVAVWVATALVTTLVVALTAMPTALARTPAAAADIGGCEMFPANNILNVRVDTLPVHPSSAAFVNSIGSSTALHPDFGTTYLGAPIGIPYITVPDTQAPVNITFHYDTESDPGPYPIPADAPIEGGSQNNGDRHILMVQTPSCKLWEVFSSYAPNTSGEDWCVGGAWCAGSGAVWNLHSNALRPNTWTSADAAGLPILPLLVRYDEATAGEIRHAIRFTADVTRNAYVWPARHQASDTTSLNVPPLGMRFRLKASVNVETMNISPEAKVIFRALQRYGMLLADNGSNWYISGAHDMRWKDEELVDAFNLLHGRDFEAVDSSSLMVSVNSGEVKASSVTPTPTIPPFVPNHWTHLPFVLR